MLCFFWNKLSRQKLSSERRVNVSFLFLICFFTKDHFFNFNVNIWFSTGWYLFLEKVMYFIIFKFAVISYDLKHEKTIYLYFLFFYHLVCSNKTNNLFWLKVKITCSCGYVFLSHQKIFYIHLELLFIWLTIRKHESKI